MLEFETRGRYSNSESSLGIKVGNIFYGTEGYLELNSGDMESFPQEGKRTLCRIETFKCSNRKQNTLTGTEGAEHFANFIDAIRSGKDSDLICSITEGHFSAALPHLANISHRLGRGLKFMNDQEKFYNDAEADGMLKRTYRKPYVLPDKV